MKITLVIILICADQLGLSQGFVNLNFEAANLSAYGAGPAVVPVTNAIPGWSAYVGNSPQTSILYNNVALGNTSIAIFSTNGFNGVIDGTYSINLFGGLTDTSASISQTGVVPASAQTLLFEAKPVIGTLLVSLGGQSLSFYTLSTGSGYSLYAADISAFANQTEDLTFSALQGGNNYWTIDDIQFSSSPIPEPSTLSLIALGGLFLARLRWRKSFQAG